MAKKPNIEEAHSDLRTLAERQMQMDSTQREAMRHLDRERLLHELEVHQIELEMQNAELRAARDEAEGLLGKYTDLYDFAPVGYFTLDDRGGIRLANLTGSAMIGIERGRLVGRTFASFLPVGKRTEFLVFLKRVMESTERSSIDCEIVRTGRQPLSVNIEVQCSSDRRECRAVMVDITAHREAEEILGRNKALFTALIEKVPVGVYVINGAFQLQQANPLAMKLLANIHPLIGRDCSEIIHILWPRRVADQVVARFRRTLRTGESYQSSEFSHRRLDIGLDEVYEWQIQRVTLPAGEFGVVCYFTNITKRIRDEAVRRQLEVLTESNLRLSKEIAKRRIVESSLLETKEEQASLLEKSRLQQLQLRELSYKILQVQEDERKRISRELHDVISQTLVGINLHLASLTQGKLKIPKLLLEKIARTQQLIEDSVEVVHQFSLELRPTVLDDLGIIPALHAYLKKFMADTGIRASFNVFGGIEKESTPVRLTLYRVAQEALANVAKHAEASEVSVRIEAVGKGIRMNITDNGIGFDVENVSTSRLGLLGMKERVEMTGGTFHADSVPGSFTTIRVEFGRVPKRAIRVKSTLIP
jgi:PAS domain S-box-containing protein